MCRIAFIFACLAGAGHGRQVPTPVLQIHDEQFARDWQLRSAVDAALSSQPPIKSSRRQLASLILALDPAAAFMSSISQGLMQVERPKMAPAHSRIPMNAQMFFDAAKKSNGAQGNQADITWVGPKPNIFQGPPVTKSQAVAGQNIKDIAAAEQIPIKYSCKQGKCRTCVVEVNGQKVPACRTKVPKGQVTIEYTRTKEELEGYNPKKKNPNALSLEEQIALQNAEKAKNKFSFR
mmetsp:Transcript_148624/g.276884  ORF Transcript_148624/g.276884 Transcript_148624/m.276884 type:complete len:235 (-) Transcript_148624:139-843(-)